MKTRISFLANSILLATSTGLLSVPAIAAQQHDILKSHPEVIHKNLEDTSETNEGLAWGVAKPDTQDAVLSNVEKKSIDNRNIYYSHGAPRTDKDKQKLTVENSILSEHHINMSKGGSAELVMNHSQTDFIEAGNEGANTNTKITLNNTKLTGEDDNLTYGKDLPGSKSYMRDIAIYQDAKDTGNFSAEIGQESDINGGIQAMNDHGTKTVKVFGNSKVRGDILLNGDTTSMNVNHSTVTGSMLLVSQHDAIVNVEDSVVHDIDAAGVSDTSITLTKHAPVAGQATPLNISAGALDAHGNTTHIGVTGYQTGAISAHATDKADLTLKDATVNGDVTQSGQTTTLIADHSQITGNVALTAEKSQVVMRNASQVSGNLVANSASGASSLDLDDSSNVKGVIQNFTRINVTGHHDLQARGLKNQTVSLHNHGAMTLDTMNDSTVNMDSTGHLRVTGSLSGHNVLRVESLNPDMPAGVHALGEFKGNDLHALKVGFKAAEPQVVARAGARNYDLSLKAVQLTPERTDVYLEANEAGLTSDVRGAVAALEGARQSGTAVAGSIADHLRAGDAVANGAGVWVDYLMHNGANRDAVNYDDKLQGSVLGIDWTQDAGERGHLTSGVALSYAQNRLDGGDRNGNFSDKLNGRFYSLYTGWQQGEGADCCGYFANGSFTYGNLNTAQRAENVTAMTDNVREQLRADTRTKTYNAEIRGGITFKATRYLDLQPYAVGGWSKATDSGFSNAYVHVDNNQNETWYLGGGLRVSSHLDVGSIGLKPWIDAAYTTELGKKADFRVNGDRVTGSHQRRTGTYSAGLDADITPQLGVNAGVFTGSGDIHKSVGVLAGVKYTF